MRTILFPTDFSSNASQAFQFAALVAKSIDARIVMLNVYTIPTISEYQLPYEIEGLILSHQKNATETLKDFTQKVVAEANFPASNVSEMVEYGFISNTIVDIAKSINADLIVMGTHGATNFWDKVLGTNAQKVIKKAPCPVWVIPASNHTKLPHSILYAADFEADEIVATHQLLNLIKPLKAECKVLHVNEYFEMNVGHQVEAMVDMLEDELTSDHVQVKSIVRDNAIRGLSTYIKTHKPDAIAIALHEKSFLDSLFEKSVSTHFVQVSKIPILFFRK